MDNSVISLLPKAYSQAPRPFLQRLCDQICDRPAPIIERQAKPVDGSAVLRLNDTRRTTCTNSELWGMAMSALTPGAAAAILIRDLPGDPDPSVFIEGREGRLYLHGMGYSDGRRFDLLTRTVHAGDLHVWSHTQRSGLGRTIMRNQIEFFHAAGFDHFRIQAAREAGAYSWPRMGFLPEMPIAADFLQDLQHRFAVAALMMSAEEKSAMAQLIQLNEAEDVWKISDQATDMTPRLRSFFNHSAQYSDGRALDGRGREIANTLKILFHNRIKDEKPVSLGQVMLCALSFPAVLDFHNVAQMKRAGAYVGGWKYIGFAEKAQP